MASTAQKTDACDWEKLDAPKIKRSHLVVAFAAYAVWMIFLTFLAISRWSSLQ